MGDALFNTPSNPAASPLAKGDAPKRNTQRTAEMARLLNTPKQDFVAELEVY